MSWENLLKGNISEMYKTDLQHNMHEYCNVG